MTFLTILFPRSWPIAYIPTVLYRVLLDILLYALFSLYALLQPIIFHNSFLLFLIFCVLSLCFSCLPRYTPASPCSRRCESSPTRRGGDLSSHGSTPPPPLDPLAAGSPLVLIPARGLPWPGIHAISSCSGFPYTLLHYRESLISWHILWDATHTR